MTHTRRLARSPSLRALLAACVLLLSCPATAQVPAPPAAAARSTTLDEARELIKNGDYDRAIEILKSAVAESRGRIEETRDAYLLLIKAYVTLGNSLKLRPQGREASNLNYKEARELIAECLRIRELRHTQPEPAYEYPPEMIAFFAEVRSRIFGSIRIVGLDPPDAVVRLDGDTLRAREPGGVPGDVNVATGAHQMTIRREGVRTVTDEVVISPNSVLERSYRLNRKRGGVWYVTVAAGAAAVAVGAILLGQKSSPSATATEQPLPGPPPPP